MATTQHALICAVLALIFWTAIGFSISSRLMPPSLALPSAPLMGWATHSVLALPILIQIGMSRTAVLMVFALSAIAATVALLKIQGRAVKDDIIPSVPILALLGAAILALVPMFAALPTISADGAALAASIFDHSKVAMIDDMARLGVPAGNPFFQETGGLGRLSYYYLWHFSAAELSAATGLSGWEADAGLTWFTAFSTLTLMMGLANLISSQRYAAGWVLLIAAATSLRQILRGIIGWKLTNALTGWPSGFGGWLFQVTWAPQHVASAGCVVIAIILFIRMAERQNWSFAILISLIAAAAFQSSTWVGGVTFPLATIAVTAIMLARIEPSQRRHYLLFTLVAAVIAIAFSSLFIHDQLRAAIARADGTPIAIMPYYALGEEFPDSLHLILDFPAFWTVFLLTEFAAFYPIGFIFLMWFAKDRALPRDAAMMVLPLGLTAFISLGVGSILVSTAGGNNDLAWRGVLPAVFVLVAFTAAGFSRYLRTMRPLHVTAALLLVGFGVYNTARNLSINAKVSPQPSAKLFLDSVKLWGAVRSQTAADERVANNPLFLSDMTNWPVNISWALLANRRSCYASADLVGPFAPLTRQRREEVDAQFLRVFSGLAEGDDVQQLATRYNCDVIVLTPQDGAWTKDPFAASSYYRLTETKEEAWRIYRVQSPKRGAFATGSPYG